MRLTGGLTLLVFNDLGGGAKHSWKDWALSPHGVDKALRARAAVL
jgi:hypothetical protein